ncbi:ABC transporter permease [Gynuella sunshinyii]|uniref:ABC-type antimicrobial peptide transport system, permease component n=1 Tax=Gynuella sunshinyii YC6258 TaxID=1445510 RepID=A0A0C5VF31_9GAMM|nr:ABC transporter permease [Gynuella sunshinyii]AJQ97875.1 ABC-type antimicrobial peptide transport system, permease component [Gynuella sunshinyii YC6258]
MNLIHQTLVTLYAHRLRSLLALIAIILGIVSVLILVALGEGFYRVNTRSFELLIDNSQTAYPGWTSKPWQGLPARRVISFTDVDWQTLRRHPAVASLSVVYDQSDVSLSNAAGRRLQGYVTGADNDYLDLNQIRLNRGSRPFNQRDQQLHQRVALIGWQLAQTGNLSVGQPLLINSVAFTVVGIIRKSEGGVSFGNNGSQVLIPVTAFRDLWDQSPDSVVVKAADGVPAALLRQQLLDFFARVKNFDPTDQEAINLPDLSSGARFFKTLLRGIQMFLGASGAMTLAVGSLGVANIMFLSVTERTREIGVRLAIGATSGNILGQFLLEGMILVMLGTLSGVAVAFVVVSLLNAVGLPDWLGQPLITSASVWIVLFITALLALLAVYFPARRAAAMTPVRALSARA